MIVFNMDLPDNLYKLVKGENVGTVIKDETKVTEKI